jgi:VanZ family protein
MGAPRGLGPLAHALAYLVLAWLVRRAVGPDGFVRGILFPLSIAWGFGLAVEILQPGISSRIFEVADLAANAAGAAAGLALPARRDAAGEVR